MIIQNCSPICITNPSTAPVIVHLVEAGTDRPDRFAWDAASCTCVVSLEAHRSACDSHGVHRLFVVSLFMLLFDLGLVSRVWITL